MKTSLCIRSRVFAALACITLTGGICTASEDVMHAYVALSSMPYAHASNALLANAPGPNSYGIRGAVSLRHDTVLFDGSERHYIHDHHAQTPGSACTSGPSCSTVVGADPNYRQGGCPSADSGCVTVIGHEAYENGPSHSGQVYIPSTTIKDVDDEIHASARIAKAPLYAGIGTFQRSSSYAGYPKIRGVGVGLSYAPNFKRRLSPFGSVWHYPHVSGTYRGAASASLGTLSGAAFTLAYRVTTFEVGTAYTAPKSPLFAALSIHGERSQARGAAPVGTMHNEITATFGLHT